MKDLLECHGIVLVERAGSLLMDAAALEKALPILRDHKIHPIGLEGFHLRNDSIIPDMGMIIDMSDVATVEDAIECIQQAIVARNDSSLLFELVIAEN